MGLGGKFGRDWLAL